MKKSDVYSWRVDPTLKSELEEAARTEGTSVAQLLNRIVSLWLKKTKAATVEDEAIEYRMRQKAMRTFGSVLLDEGPYTANQIRQRVRTRLKKKHAATRPD